ncbi:hypothetical protein PLICRDRAFT_32429 [Plicaturopsis crispa FD-325 SS-3]|uniref:Uncharacterized protein n=1 Tax=Plicaturopsis crispa FD-325 SS-3 TaxID=944288 RepID=A0A0C9SXH6_PLICR|nr:hypothetical protein PLICRDRAFT_32429 [Plicaturopsis crispa FD-325 SS-3]
MKCPVPVVVPRLLPAPNPLRCALHEKMRSSSPAAPDPDAEFLDSVPAGVLREFRNHTVPTHFVEGNAALFLGTDWVNTALLRAFMRDRGKSRHSALTVSSSPASTPPASSSPLPSPGFSALRVKREDVPRPALSFSSGSRVKAEPCDDSDGILDLTGSSPPTFRSRVLREGGTEIIELLSSDEECSDEELDGLDGQVHDYRHAAVDVSSASLPTNWHDPVIQSTVVVGYAKVTRQVHVDRVEYLNELPSYWPVPRVPTAFILDLSDPKFAVEVNDSEEICTPDWLVKNKDQESWSGGTGAADSKPFVNLIVEGQSVLCRRSRLTCRGVYACEDVDPKLLKLKTRAQEGSTTDKLVATFWNVIHEKKCGPDCNAKPRLVPSKFPGRKKYFIGCKGWSRASQNHRITSIPDNVDEEALFTLFHNGSLKSEGAKATCSRVVSPHIGAKLKHCNYTHIQDGKPVRTRIVHHKCPAERSIFIPEDPSIRVVLVLPNHTKPHSHPMPPAIKVSYDAKDAYAKLIGAHGALGATVKGVDNAPSTKLALGGLKPADVHPALLQARTKRDLVRQAKIGVSPLGLGILAIVQIFLNEKTMVPIAERYIHRVVHTPADGTIILTLVPFLAGLIHEAWSIEADGTFKRQNGPLNEWEIVIWYPPLNRLVTVGRAYSDRASRVQYKMLFDELQAVVLEVTGKPLRFKCLSEGGNLLTLGVDLELAQILGAGDSFLPTNEPVYSGITTTDPEELVQYFVRACYSHVKRGIHDLKSSINDEQFKRIMDFPYIKNDTDLDAFTDWVDKCGVPKVQISSEVSYATGFGLNRLVEAQADAQVDHPRYHPLQITDRS